MLIIANCLILLVGIEHLGIMWVEMFGQPQQQAKAFDLSTNLTSTPEVRILFANQGIYNGMLGLSLLLTYWLFTGIEQATAQYLLLTFVVVVALYGGLTATKKIWLIQLLPAALAIITLILAS
ncbi:DUF1304 domain-containing protein [uncultured Limosilactobacillus sp.]|uniref:DUF1304 domain-containing protein n=1 Tax=uncultured Limosilactobacillus sp. TaxID=2837629 RepID=UPI0025CC71C5|nr:DUF1304 domain-containing protein [uncultured Limosilactobacillus sp.]